MSFPNINPVEESVNLMEAARSYQLNVSAIQTTKAMIQSAIRNRAVSAEPAEEFHGQHNSRIAGSGSRRSDVHQQRRRRKRPVGFLRRAAGRHEIRSSSLHADAQGKVAGMLDGTGEDVHSAMIAVEKAGLAFEMMVQVRNKIVQAYQTVSQMQF